MIKIIVAYDKNKLIGSNNKLPWNYPEDLKHFQKEVANKQVVIGDITYSGLSSKVKANLKLNILTNNKEFINLHKELRCFNTVKEVIDMYKEEDIYVVGGAKVYSSFLPYVDELIITKINKEFEGDTYFPNWKENEFSLIKTKRLNNDCTVEYYKKI